MLTATMATTDKSDKLQELASDFDKSLPDVRKEYQELLTETKQQVADDVQGDFKDMTIKRLRAKYIRENRSGGRRSGVKELPIVALGHAGPQLWNDNDKDNDEKKTVIKAYGIVNPPNNPAGLCSFICDESEGVDLGNVREKFDPLNTLKGLFTLDEADGFEDTVISYYVANSTGETTIKEVDPEESDDPEIQKLPTDRRSKRDMINDNFIQESIDLDSIEEYMSRTGPNNEYPAGFGVDIKRIEGQVVDKYRDFDSDMGVYTILDDTVIDPDDLMGTKLMREDADENATPGLTVYLPPEQVKFREDSRIVVYGTVSTSNDGQVLMRGVGSVGIVGLAIDDDDTQDTGEDI